MMSSENMGFLTPSPTLSSFCNVELVILSLEVIFVVKCFFYEAASEFWGSLGQLGSVDFLIFLYLNNCDSAAIENNCTCQFTLKKLGLQWVGFDTS